MRCAMLVLFGLLMVHSVKANFPFEAFAGDILRIVYGNEGPSNAAHILEVMSRTTGDTIKQLGYPYEKHVITTSDGYLLEMHRIPNTKNNGSKSVPIIIVPALLTESGDFVIRGIEDSPAFFFSEAGYDVWLHNHRGTRYSRKHVTLSPDFQKEFWNFSFHEMGVYDLPAAVDYITSTTESKQVYLLGPSMGGTVTTIFLAEKPDYRDKVKAAFLLAPAIYVQGTHNPFAKKLLFLTKIFLFFMDDMEVFPYNNNTLLLAASFFLSPIGNAVRLLMPNVLSTPTDTEDLFLEKVSRMFAGTNGKVLRHFLQLVNRNDFTKFDYGAEGNMAAYGTETPPEYILDAIDVPVSIFYSDGDTEVVSEDIFRAASKFKQLISLTRVGDEKFDHFDFLLSEYVKFQLFDPILAQMSELESDKPSSNVTNIACTVLFIILILIAIRQIMVFVRKHADSDNKILI